MRVYEDGYFLFIFCVDYLFIQLYLFNLAQVGDGVNFEEIEVFFFVKDMEGKIYKLQVRVSLYNFIANYQIFIIFYIFSEGVIF